MRRIHSRPSRVSLLEALHGFSDDEAAKREAELECLTGFRLGSSMNNYVGGSPLVAHLRFNAEEVLFDDGTELVPSMESPIGIVSDGLWVKRLVTKEALKGIKEIVGRLGVTHTDEPGFLELCCDETTANADYVLFLNRSFSNGHEEKMLYVATDVHLIEREVSAHFRNFTQELQELEKDWARRYVPPEYNTDQIYCGENLEVALLGRGQKRKGQELSMRLARRYSDGSRLFSTHANSAPYGPIFDPELGIFSSREGYAGWTKTPKLMLTCERCDHDFERKVMREVVRKLGKIRQESSAPELFDYRGGWGFLPSDIEIEVLRHSTLLPHKPMAAPNL
ncbi:MAG: hypothetical protein ABIA93_03745 [Candidatus Woesearchaeota archaeon]